MPRLVFMKATLYTRFRLDSRPRIGELDGSRTPRAREGEEVKKTLRRSTVLLVVLAAAAAATVLVTGATASTKKKAAGGDVCVLFPDPATSIRWVHYDAPAMKSALKAAGVTAQIYNADGDAQKQKAQADQCLASGAKVIVEVAIDAGSAGAIEKEAK